MAARWMERLRAKMKHKPLRFVPAGSAMEAKRVARYAVDMPSKAIDTTELVNGVKVKRIDCKGIVPPGGYRQGACRKARNGPVELWTGGKQAANRNHVAPGGKGMIANNMGTWADYEARCAEPWAIVKRA